MASTSTSEAARIQQEIAALTGAINRHKTGSATQPTGYSTRSNTYINPNYKPPSSQSKPPSKPNSYSTSMYYTPKPSTIPTSGSSQTRDVVIGGIAFESSGRSLVRKDLPKPSTTKVPSRPSTNSHKDLSRTLAGHLIPNGRTYKPMSPRGRGRGRSRGGPVNMTLDNNRRPYRASRSANKRSKLDKPCPRFTSTGACSRGLTCMYQHDPSKIAICWTFLQGNCPNNADNCQLSHDPTPERTPLCVHFANNGRCNRDNCPFPHVRVGHRDGICRDFAVLGYCAKGLDCDKQHIRECPDFAEKGSCTTKGCKLPHVIRANRNRKLVPLTSNTAKSAKGDTLADSSSIVTTKASTRTETDSTLQTLSAEDAQLGDEYISLTFHESDSSEEDSEEEDSEEEGDDPTVEDSTEEPQ